MTEHEWLTTADPVAMLSHVRGGASDRKLRLFAVAFCSHIWDRLYDLRCQAAVNVAELYADGLSTCDECNARRGEAVTAAHNIESARGPYGGSPVTAAAFYTAAAAASASAFDAARSAACYPPPAPADASEAANYNYIITPSVRAALKEVQVALLHDIFGNPFGPASAIRPSHDAIRIATLCYDNKDWSGLPVLADALEEGGCTDAGLLGHLRDGRLAHARGCWVVDLVLGKG